MHLDKAFTVGCERLRTDAPEGADKNLPRGPGGHGEQAYVVASARRRELAAGRGGCV